MPKTPYYMKDVSLAAIIALGDIAGGSQLAPPGMPVTDIGVITLPAGAVGAIRIHLGQRGDPIPLNLVGQNFHLAEPETTGVWISVPAAIGAVTVQFLIGLQANVEAHS